MKRYGLILPFIFLVSLLIPTANSAAYTFENAQEDQTNEIEENEPVVKNLYYTGEQPFFNEVYDNIQIDNTKDVDKYFAENKPIGNTSNFCSLGTASYDNINGKTVTVDGFYRFMFAKQDDPNFGQCMLVYQAIQYKIKHPNEKVTIAFTSYYFSASASACLRRDSKYFGYMRSMFEEDYDDFGFVKLAVLFVEAAKMGIELVFTPQLNAYGTQQKDPNNPDIIFVRPEPSYKAYFAQYLDMDCYSQYCPGKKVKDYFEYAPNEWKVGSVDTDMLHEKSCVVSAYTDYQGVDHQYGCYFSSANFDAVDYYGRNGNTGSQSGFIITNHEPIYRCTLNYIRLLAKYSGVDQSATFREIVKDRNNEQIKLLNNGEGNKINKDEQIVYLRNQNDNVFELYFAPFGGGNNTWNRVYNPYCKYVPLLRESDGPITLSWTSTYTDYNCTFDYSFDKYLAKTFQLKKNVRNRLFIHAEAFGKNLYDNLLEGRDLAYKSINEYVGTYYLHSKDMFMTYYEGIEKKYVSILSTANIGLVEYWYRPNGVVVINETESNHAFYDILAEATFSAGFFWKNV